MTKLDRLLRDIRACTVCEKNLPLGANPILRAKASARLLIVGQAPGVKVHESSIPWKDASGNKLREWLQVDSDTFYDDSKIAIVPMGFCYPGKGKSGDLPPREECAPLWHSKILKLLPQIQLTLLFGQYSQNYYLKNPNPTLTETVRDWKKYTPKFLPMPHPSPRNRIWLKKNPWFEQDVVPYLRRKVQKILS